MEKSKRASFAGKTILAFSVVSALSCVQEPSTSSVKVKRDIVDLTFSKEAHLEEARTKYAAALRLYEGTIEHPRADTIDIQKLDSSTLETLAAYLKDPTDVQVQLDLSANLQHRADSYRGQGRKNLYELALNLHQRALPFVKIRLMRETIQNDIQRMKSRLLSEDTSFTKPSSTANVDAPDKHPNAENTKLED